MGKNIISTACFQKLASDCRDIIEKTHESVIKGYHQLGERISTDSNYKKWQQNSAGRVLTDLSKALDMSERSIYRAIRFYDKFPRLADLLQKPDITWNKIITEYLPEPKKQKIVIDKEFSEMLPRLRSYEYKGLEKMILRDGCRDPLVLWGDILLDGHQRFRICSNHEIPFETRQPPGIKDRNDAKVFILNQQLARKNLTEDQLGCLSYMASRR